MKLFEPNRPYYPKVSMDITDVAELNRQATAFKGKDWDSALACLMKAKELMDDQYQDFPQRLRLPLFLQQAGEFDAAKYEFAYLLDNIDRYVELEITGRQDKKLQRAFLKNLCLERLFDKARVMFKREKLKDEEEQCRLLSEQYQEKRLKARVALDEAMKNRRDEHRTKFSKNQLANESNHKISIRDDTAFLRDCNADYSRPESQNKIETHQAQKSGCLSTSACMLLGCVFLTWLLV